MEEKSKYDKPKADVRQLSEFTSPLGEEYDTRFFIPQMGVFDHGRVIAVSDIFQAKTACRIYPDALHICINTKTKKTRWVRSLADAEHFFNSGYVDE